MANIEEYGIVKDGVGILMPNMKHRFRIGKLDGLNDEDNASLVIQRIK